MKKGLFVGMIVAALVLASCAAPAAENSADSPVPQSGTDIFADDLRDLISQYEIAGDDRALYETAIKQLELDPSDTDAYLVALEALASLSKQNYDEISRLLELGGENAEDVNALAQWVEGNQPDYSISMPFVPDSSADEINTDGITTGNLSNAAKYGGWWIGGLLTWQGNWVYLSRPDEDFAVYKMRADGSEYQRLGEENGSSLNVIGDWIYYINHNDGNKAYKMRTDGSMKTKLTDDDCAFLSVSATGCITTTAATAAACIRGRRTAASRRSWWTPPSCFHVLRTVMCITPKSGRTAACTRFPSTAASPPS